LHYGPNEKGLTRHFAFDFISSSNKDPIDNLVINL